MPLTHAELDYAVDVGLTPLDRAAAQARLIEPIVSDRIESCGSEALRLAEAVFALLPDDVDYRELWGAYPEVAMSHAMIARERAGQFSVLVVYLNDQ